MTAHPRPPRPPQQRTPYERRRIIATFAGTVVVAVWLYATLGDDQASPAPVVVPAAATVYVQQFAAPTPPPVVIDEIPTQTRTERVLPSGRVARGAGGSFTNEGVE